MKTFRLKSGTKTALVAELQEKFPNWDGVQDVYSSGNCAFKFLGKIPNGTNEAGEITFTSQWHADVLAPEIWDFGALEMVEYPETPYHNFAK